MAICKRSTRSRHLVPAFRTDTLDATWPAAEGADGMAPALDRLCREATAAVEAGHNILILSDRATSAERVPIPALLATSAVHHHLIRQGLRTSTGIVVETGEAREVHHFCALAGYGAEAINPYLAFATLGTDPHRERSAAQRRRGAEELSKGARQRHPQGHVQDGHLDLSILLRRADLRRGRARQRVLSRNTSPARRRRSRASGCARSPRKRSSATATPMATTRSITRCSMSAAITPFGCAARTMPGRRNRSPDCSTRCAATRWPNTGPLPPRSTIRASGC